MSRPPFPRPSGLAPSSNKVLYLFFEAGLFSPGAVLLSIPRRKPRHPSILKEKP